LAALAGGLQQQNLDTNWGVETVLRSRLFFSNASLRGRIDGPVEWAIGAVRALELADPPPSTLLVAEWTTRMGQDLFYPPNVGGWLEGRSWLGSQSIVARANFAAALMDGRLWHPTRTPNMLELVARHRKTEDLAESVAWAIELLWGDTHDTTVTEIVAASSSRRVDDRLSTAIALLLARPESQLS
jgi:hypothetical protein